MGKGEVRCDLGDLESTGDAAACDAVSADSCGSSRGLPSASISGCGVGLRPIFATPAAECRKAAQATWSGAGGLLLCSPLTGVCRGVGHGALTRALGGRIGDDGQTPERAGRCSKAQRVRRDAKEGMFGGDSLPQLCLKMQLAKGQAGGGETRRTIAVASAWLAGVVEKGGACKYGASACAWEGAICICRMCENEHEHENEIENEIENARYPVADEAGSV